MVYWVEKYSRGSSDTVFRTNFANFVLWLIILLFPFVCWRNNRNKLYLHVFYLSSNSDSAMWGNPAPKTKSEAQFFHPSTFTPPSLADIILQNNISLQYINIWHVLAAQWKMLQHCFKSCYKKAHFFILSTSILPKFLKRKCSHAPFLNLDKLASYPPPLYKAEMRPESQI